MEESRGGERESAGHGRVRVGASWDARVRHCQRPVSGGVGGGGELELVRGAQLKYPVGQNSLMGQCCGPTFIFLEKSLPLLLQIVAFPPPTDVGCGS